MSDATTAATTAANDALPLTEQMRLATRQAHAISDKLVNLKLVVALTNKTVYGQSLLLFYYVFAQIEQSVEARKDHEVIKSIHAAFKPLVRADVIKKDLDFYLGADWSKKFAPPPAVVAYVKRIQEVEKEDPVLLLAYAYHMYMALLFGGQMIKKMVKRSFSVEGESGLETFEFGGKSKMALRSSLKDALNGLELEAEPKSRLLQESNRVFKMNNEVVRGIEGMFKQLMLWLMKWIIVIQLIYWTYWFFVHGNVSDVNRFSKVFPSFLPHSSNRPATRNQQTRKTTEMEGEHQPPPYREDYAPPVDSYNRGPPGPPPPGNYGAPPHDNRDAYASREPPMQEPDMRGRDWNDRRRDHGGYDGGRPHGGGGGGWGAPRGRSRSRSPPGGYGRNGGGGGGGYHQGPPPQRGDWQNRQDDGGNMKNGSGAGRAERKAVQSIEPMDSYKVFMMRQDENSTPETYQQRYEEYKKKYTQRLMRAFFDDHKNEEWLQERYSPAIRFRVDQQKRNAKITEAKQFVERVISGVAKINMDEENELTGQDYENDLEDSKRILYVRRVPCACPVATLSEAIKKAGGNFQHIYLSDPVKKSTFDFDRSAYIIYESAEAAAEALPKIHNTFVQDGDLFTPVRLQVSQHRSRAPLKTPSYLSVPDRLTYDYEQSLKLAKLLDQALFVKGADLNSTGIEALLADETVASTYTSDKQKLDVIVAYLRRVHHYIYYAAVQCIDMGDIMHAHPALFCRPPPSSKDLDEEKVRKESVGGADESIEQKGGWAASLDEKVLAYIEELSPENIAAKHEKDKNLVDEIEAREETALETTYANYAEKAGEDGKHRCRLCTKLFKAMDFVKKHIRNKHPELVEDKVAEVGESYMWEQYREDANRPLPPVETTNTLTNPVLGGRGGSSYQGRSGPGRGGYGGPPGNRGGYSRDGPGYRGGYGGPPRDNRPRRGSFGDNRGRSPPRYSNRPPEGDLPVDPRQVSRSYQDLDNLQDSKVELSFDALNSLPPPKKKTKV